MRGVDCGRVGDKAACGADHFRIRRYPDEEEAPATKTAGVRLHDFFVFADGYLEGAVFAIEIVG